MSEVVRMGDPLVADKESAKVDASVADNARKKFLHYHKDVSNLEFIDVYRLLLLFNVTDPCLQHSIKKLLVAGGRSGGKDINKDVAEAIVTLQRWQEIQRENATKPS
jgi:hypothetical protein